MIDYVDGLIGVGKVLASSALRQKVNKFMCNLIVGNYVYIVQMIIFIIIIYIAVHDCEQYEEERCVCVFSMQYKNDMSTLETWGLAKMYLRNRLVYLQTQTDKIADFFVFRKR